MVAIHVCINGGCVYVCFLYVVSVFVHVIIIIFYKHFRKFSILLQTFGSCDVTFSFLPPSLYLSLCASSRRSSDQMDLMVDGLPVSLPSYEEAVYGSWGQRLTPCSGPGPTQLLLAQEAPGHSLSTPHNQSDASRRLLPSHQSPEHPPPAYEEVQSRRREGMSGGEVNQLQVALSDDKDTWMTGCGVNAMIRFVCRLAPATDDARRH